MKNSRHSIARAARGGGATTPLSGVLFCAAFLLPGFSQAQLEIPELTVKENGQNQKLELQEFSIDVRLDGLLVETVLELEFFNHTARRQEGEFRLQLPEGATVSTYALDINGKMRPGVSVEKEKARHAYETIKRKMIDPGLVEREAGNVYRTRIFPIEPKKPKRVRIGYIRNLAATLKKPLPPDAETIPFEFEFKNKEKLKRFHCRIFGAAAPPVLTLPNLPGATSDREGEFTWKAENIALTGSLKARSKIPVAGKPMVRHESASERGNSYFVVQGRLPEIKPEAADKPKKFRLIWDASFSGRTRDHEQEIAALTRYVKWLGNVTVSFQTLRNELGPIQSFAIRGGDVEEFEKLLRGVSYDGAADFSKIEEDSQKILLVTDGEKTSPVWAISDKFTAHNLYLVTSTSQATDPGLLASATMHVDLLRDAWWDILTGKIPALVVESLPKSEWSASRAGGFFTVTGRLKKNWQGAAVIRKNGEVVRKNGEGVILGPKAERLRDRDPWTFTRRIWAQQQLRALENAGDARKITEFAKSERLVSDYTSLIVLERFEDHLTYKIPPPEPEVLARYQEALEERHDSARQTAIGAWKRKLTWHGTDFPWMDSHLHEESSAVAIWVKASRAVFLEDELDKKMIGAFESWIPKAQSTIDRKNTLKDQKEFAAWKSDVGRRIAELRQIREKRVLPEVGQPIHVSVRGFVQSRGVVSDEAPTSLKHAIDLAGGPFLVPLSRVYLYRDALRTGYNLESAQYSGVPLYNGDMIVVEADIPDNRGAAGGAGFDSFAAAPDPFAAPSGGGGGAGSGRSGAPIFEETGTARAAAIPLGQPNQPGFAPNGKVERKLNVTLVARKPKPMATEVDQAVLETLRKHADPAAYYQELTEGIFIESAPSAATIIEIARFFFGKADSKLGNRALSNLVEIQSNKFEATRALAYWLAEFNQANLKIMEDLVQASPDEVSRAIASYDVAQIFVQNDFDAVAPPDAWTSPDWYSSAVLEELNGGEPGALSTIALTDHFRRSGQPAGSIGREHLRGFLAQPMNSDVRIVVTSCGDQVDLFVTEPEAKVPTGPVGTSIHGGRVDQSERVQEYQVRFGMPGSYQVMCRRTGFVPPSQPNDPFHEQLKKDLKEADLQPVTIQVAYYTNWGKANEELRVRTYLMENLELELDGLEFGWAE